MRHFSSHAWERVEGRLTEAGVPMSDLVTKAEKLAPQVPGESGAVLLMTLPSERGDVRGGYHGRESNGSQVWMVVRGGRIVTVMLRRENQPSTAEAMRVDRVFVPQ